MKTKLRILFLVVELNLILWMIVAGDGLSHRTDVDGVWSSGPVTVEATLIFIGLGFAAIVQHWAYYAVYRAAKRLPAADDADFEVAAQRR